MDTKQLIIDAKARFNHNSAKHYLVEKYKSKLIVADQGGLWNADPTTITLLQTFDCEDIVLVDTFGNPVRVNRVSLLNTLKEIYTQVMNEWHIEWKDLENKR